MEQKGQRQSFQNNIEVIQFRIKKMLEYAEIKPQSLEKLPQTFYAFAKQRGLDVQELALPIPRYIRLKPSLEISEEQLCQKLGLNLKQIVQIDKHFWAINPDAKINKCSLYEQGLLYGMDYSSAIPVKCLQISQGSNVLEICSAPGNKSMLMADSYQEIKIKAIEINQNRANIMNSLVTKYKLQHKIEVLVCDGLKFQSQKLFDRVLVDAECTHQGSLKHIHKFFKEDSSKKEIKKNKMVSKQQEKQYKLNNINPYTSEILKKNEWSRQDFQERFLDPYKIANLQNLQTGLLQTGFKLLKYQGIIVYSTCSFDQQQNQDIIEKFLQKHTEAELIDAGKDLQCGVGWRYGKLKGTLRFSPSISLCGGMFIAKMKKH